MLFLGNSNSGNRGGGAQTEEEAGGGVASSPALPSQGGGVGSLPGSVGNVREEKPAEVVPCPRCESMNTKFCYFNNYSTKQPRYFCRQCQRYWTVGGTLRNVPVGGGSRKKNRNQRSEPYLRAATHSGGGGVTLLSSGAAAVSGNNPLLQHTLGFQQLLMQDVNLPCNMMTAYELQEQYLEHQNLGLFYPVINKSMNNNTPELSVVHPMYAASQGGVECGSDPVVAHGAHHPMLNVNGSYFCTPNNKGDFLHGDSISQVIQWGNLLPTKQLQTDSIWNESRHQSGSPSRSASDEEEINRRNCSSPQSKLQEVVKAKRYEPCNISDNNTTMLLQLLSLNKSRNINKPGFEGCCVASNNGSSPPHGSSTIEEEGSTPTNGYSTNGYEDGDAVSSMWPDLEFFH